MRPSAAPTGPVRAAALAAPLLLAAAACAPSEASRPNVLLVVMDTTRADRCSLLGHARPTTPRLEEIARDAAVFEDCWSPSSWTAPAHASLFTGLLPRNHGLQNGGTQYLDERRTTLAEILRDAGWRTGCFTNNLFVSPDNALTQGFETTDLRFRDNTRPYPWAPATTEATLAWIDRQTAEGKPFFAFVNDLEPHVPYTPAEADAARFLDEGVPAWAVSKARALVFPETLAIGLGHRPLEPETRRAIGGLYDAEVASVDHAVGALLDGLKTRGLLEKTLVVVTSDHGEGLGDHGWIEHSTYLWRELLRVPLLVRWPGAFDGGRRVRDVVRLEDVMPTVLDVCGRPVPPDLDGVSLRRDLAGRTALGTENASTGMAGTAQSRVPGIDVAPLLRNRRSAFDGRWHLVLADGESAALFDVPADPGELRNVAGDHPAEVRRLEALLQAPVRR